MAADLSFRGSRRTRCASCAPPEWWMGWPFVPSDSVRPAATPADRSWLKLARGELVLRSVRVCKEERHLPPPLDCLIGRGFARTPHPETPTKQLAEPRPSALDATRAPSWPAYLSRGRAQAGLPGGAPWITSTYSLGSASTLQPPTVITAHRQHSKFCFAKSDLALQNPECCL